MIYKAINTNGDIEQEDLNISLRDVYKKLSNHGTHVWMASVMQHLTRQDLTKISTQIQQIIIMQTYKGRVIYIK